jgi:general secretion pathway protein A
MDEQHFRLRGRPSVTAPDADAYFECRGNARALAYVRHAVLQGDSFVVLAGAPGTGKTALLDTLMSEPGPVAVVSFRLAGARFDAVGLLAAAAKALRAPVVGTGPEELRAGVQAWLATLTASDRRALLVVDDAHLLLPAALRELTELASLRSSRNAPMQVVLAGRPELRASLQRALRGAIAEPVFLFCDVGPLSAIETRWYLEHRLRRVGAGEAPRFADEAHERIHQATAGIPRAINALSDRVLLLATQRRLARVGPELVDQAALACRLDVGQAAGGAGDAASQAPRQATHDSGFEWPASRRAGGSGSGVRRGVVVAASVLAVAALVGWGLHEVDRMRAQERLSSLATATRAALPAAAADTKAGPAPITALPDAGAPAPAPPAETCTEVVIALGLCSPEARRADQP